VGYHTYLKGILSLAVIARHIHKRVLFNADKVILAKHKLNHFGIICLPKI